MPAPGSDRARLPRRLGLGHVVLYGLGVTVGAGIYALVGTTIGLAGDHAPVAFVLAAAVMLLPAACFAELTGRLPFAAAEAHFVQAGFGSRVLFVAVGLGVAAVGMVSAAAIAHGSAGYLAGVVPLPGPVLVAALVLLTGGVACLGIRASIGIAGLLTLVEIAGLLAVVGGALWAGHDLGAQALRAVPPTLSPVVWAGIFGASLLAFFAFIGFEDIDSIAEETVDPQRTLARGIFITLGVTTALYLAVVLAVLATVAPDEVAESDAPLALAFARATGLPGGIIVAVAATATLNGVTVQMIMAGRVLWGLAREGALPGGLARLTGGAVPLRATLVAIAATLALAAAFPIVALAQWTSALTLAIFALVCLALARIRARGDPAPPGTFRVAGWMPVAGAVACLLLLALGLATGM